MAAFTNAYTGKSRKVDAGGTLCLLLALFLLGACARMPAAPALPTVRIDSPNHNERRPNFVVIHQTTNDRAADALRTLTNPARQVSAHYLVDRDGTLYQLVDENRRAWHAGASYWGGSTDLNSASIGIELDNNGDEPFAEPQIAALLALLQDLKTRHRIPPANFIGHADIAPRRKVDPSRYFPWQRLAEAGFGLWCAAPERSAEPLDVPLALQALGYEVVDLPLTLAAFRRHYRGIDADTEIQIEDADRDLLRCLLRQKNALAAAAALPQNDLR